MMLITFGVIAICMSSSTSSTASAVPTPQCSPSALVNAGAKYRQICFVLLKLANALDASEGAAYGNEIPASMELRPEMFEPIENGIKRKDVDHVFLRFGRPRM
uniref:Myosuppressin n=1 Tax=Carabus violaceus TaxID=41075 RepID=A0A7U3MC12_CARVO|nr:myosuppressin [Carabus violaceus]